MNELTLAEKISTLQDSPVFSSLDAAAMSAFADMAQTESFRTGEDVFSFGDFDDQVMLVSTGKLSVSFPGNQKDAIILGRGELIGEYALVVGLRRTASIVANENCILISWNHDSFISFLKEHPSVLIYLFKKAVTRLLELEAKLRPS